MKLKIEVLQEDIDGAWRDGGNHCPVALAIKRVVKDTLDNKGYISTPVSKYSATFIRTDDNALFFAVLPWQVQMFIEMFDSHGSVEPFSFNLDFQRYASTGRTTWREYLGFE
jgi:hypothetical protein